MRQFGQYEQSGLNELWTVEDPDRQHPIDMKIPNGDRYFILEDQWHQNGKYIRPYVPVLPEYNYQELQALVNARLQGLFYLSDKENYEKTGLQSALILGLVQQLPSLAVLFARFTINNDPLNPQVQDIARMLLDAQYSVASLTNEEVLALRNIRADFAKIKANAEKINKARGEMGSTLVPFVTNMARIVPVNPFETLLAFSQAKQVAVSQDPLSFLYLLITATIIDILFVISSGQLDYIENFLATEVEQEIRTRNLSPIATTALTSQISPQPQAIQVQAKKPWFTLENIVIAGALALFLRQIIR